MFKFVDDFDFYLAECFFFFFKTLNIIKYYNLHINLKKIITSQYELHSPILPYFTNHRVP